MMLAISMALLASLAIEDPNIHERRHANLRAMKSPASSTSCRSRDLCLPQVQLLSWNFARQKLLFLGAYKQ